MYVVHVVVIFKKKPKLSMIQESQCNKSVNELILIQVLVSFFAPKSLVWYNLPHRFYYCINSQKINTTFWA